MRYIVNRLRGSTLLPLYSSSALSPCLHRCRCKCLVNFSVQLLGIVGEWHIFYKAPWLTRLTVHSINVLLSAQAMIAQRGTFSSSTSTPWTFNLMNTMIYPSCIALLIVMYLHWSRYFDFNFIGPHRYFVHYCKT